MTDRLPNLALYTTIVIALIAAVFLGEAIGSGNALTLAEIVAVLGAATWLVAARKYWWVAFAFGLGIGGFFTIPYKVYPHELALGIALLALIPQLVFSHTRRKLERPKLPLVFYILGFYLVASFLNCLLQNKGEGFGNIARAYMNATWPFIFGYFFWRHGSTTVLKAAFGVIYAATLVRSSFGLLNYYSGTVHVIPIINYTIDPQDLRASGGILIVVSGLFLLMRGPVMARVFHGCMFLLSGWAILLGGSRVGVVQLLFFPLFALAVFRKWMLLATGTFLAFLLFVILNAYPGALDRLPYRVSRGASILLLHEKLDVQEDVKDSNEWHSVALPEEAYSRWSKTPRSMFFGTGIKPYQELSVEIAYGREFLYFMAVVSADMGAYESAFWTVLAVTGLVGMLLYTWLLLWLLKHILPALLRHKKRDVTWMALFWGCYMIVSWFVFAIPAGTYPSFEIFLGLIAWAALVDDRRRNLPALAAEPAPKVVLPPSRRPSWVRAIP